MAFLLLMMIYLERSGRVFLRKLSSEVQNRHPHQKKKAGEWGCWSVRYGKIKKGSELNITLIIKVNIFV